MQIARPIPSVVDDYCSGTRATVDADISQRVHNGIEVAVYVRQAECMVSAVFMQSPGQGKALFIKRSQVVGSTPLLTVQVAHDKFAVAVYEDCMETACCSTANAP